MTEPSSTGTRRGYTHPQNHFTVIPNSVIRDTRISGNAFMVWCWLSSHRDGWQVSLESIGKGTGIGVDAVRTAIKCLTQHGYLEVLERQQDARGRYTTSREYVTLCPSWGAILPPTGDDHPSQQKPRSKPKRDNPRMDEPERDNPTPIEDQFLEDQRKENQRAPLPAASSTANRLVAQLCEAPEGELKRLRALASSAIVDGTPEQAVSNALAVWQAKPCGPGLLPNLIRDQVKLLPSTPLIDPRAAARRLAIDACAACDPNGFVELPNGSVMRCSHAVDVVALPDQAV